MEMREGAELAEIVREALHHLFDRPGLASSRLADALVERGILTDRDNLYPLLLAAIGRMKPPDGAPPRSQGWRSYRYLQLRYVECYPHESVAKDLGISLRHASRSRQLALETLADLLMPSGPRPLVLTPGRGPQDPTDSPHAQAGHGNAVEPGRPQPPGGRPRAIG
jgi:hypothetical protein